MILLAHKCVYLIATSWVWIYTAGLMKRSRTRRTAEITSDLREQAADGTKESRNEFSVASSILVRTLSGVPSDISWRMSERNQNNMPSSKSQKLVLGILVVVAVSAFFNTITVLGANVNAGWMFADIGSAVFGILLLIFSFGIPVAVGGTYLWRRANARGESTKRGRLLVMTGTLGLAGQAGLMWWTIIGPLFAAAVVVFWIFKFRSWRANEAW